MALRPISMNYQRHYTIDAEQFDYFEKRLKATEHSERRLAEFIISLVPKSVQNILDVGCGRAWVAANFCKKGVAVCSMDIAPLNVEKALLLYPFENHSGKIGDAYELSAEDDSFDVVIASEVIEHVPEPDKLIHSLFQVVKKGGKLIVSTPFKEKIRYELCIHCHQLTPANAHLHSFNEQDLQSIYKRDDLMEVQTYTFNNKLLTFLRTYILLKYLPFPLWKSLDRMANFLIPKPLNLVAVYTKK